MMQNYELMLLLNPNAMDEVDDFLKGLEDIIKIEKNYLIHKTDFIYLLLNLHTPY